jgi:hypothetical protein
MEIEMNWETGIIGKTKCDSLEKRNGVKIHILRKNETVLKNDAQKLFEG